MKRIHEIGVYKSGDLRLEVVGLNDLEATVNENTAGFVGQTTVTSRIEGQDFSDSYQISRALLQLLARWRGCISKCPGGEASCKSCESYSQGRRIK
jgi:hypothetical protein